MDKKDEPDIADQFATWLETQKGAVCQAIAARAALRSLPAAMSVVEHSTGRGVTGAGLLLSTLRATLISAVNCSLQKSETGKLKSVAETASADAAEASTEYSAAYAKARASAASARSASNAVMAHFSVPQAACSKAVYSAAGAASRFGENRPARVEAHSAVYEESRNDAPNTGFEAFQSTLWRNRTKASSLLAHWTMFQEYSRDHPVWSFWLDWYRGFMEGKPLDWDLQRRVATEISDSVWNAGPEAVAAEIERIKAEMLSEKLPMAETIELNPETGQFRAIPIPVENAPYMSALLSQISDALEDSLGGHNGLSERSGDAKKLNRVLTKYKDDPQNAELTLTRVAGSLRVQLHGSRELPDNEDNLALLNAVEEGVRGIRANHPEVAANREQLAQQAFKALAPEDKQVLEERLPVMPETSDPVLAEDLDDAIPQLINDVRLPLPDGAPPLPGADVATRIFSRASKMALACEKGAAVLTVKKSSQPDWHISA